MEFAAAQTTQQSNSSSSKRSPVLSSSSQQTNASNQHHGALIWACPTCPTPTGWTPAQTWVDNDLTQPATLHLPHSWNIDSLGPDICKKLPDPWSPYLSVTWCNKDCSASKGLGRLWPARNPNGKKRVFAAKSAAIPGATNTQKQRRSTTEHSEVVLAKENPKALP